MAMLMGEFGTQEGTFKDAVIAGASLQNYLGVGFDAVQLRHSHQEHGSASEDRSSGHGMHLIFDLMLLWNWLQVRSCS
jgi:hypothetical protein